jgi:hypothetical protein
MGNVYFLKSKSSTSLDGVYTLKVCGLHDYVNFGIFLPVLPTMKHCTAWREALVLPSRNACTAHYVNKYTCIFLFFPDENIK